MFFRRKLAGKTQYLQIVKNERVDGKPRQSVVATLGRVDDLMSVFDSASRRVARKSLISHKRIGNLT